MENGYHVSGCDIPLFSTPKRQQGEGSGKEDAVYGSTSHTHTLTHTLTHTYSHTLSHTHAHMHTHTLAHTLTLTLTHSHTGVCQTICVESQALWRGEAHVLQPVNVLIKPLCGQHKYNSKSTDRKESTGGQLEVTGRPFGGCCISHLLAQSRALTSS